MFRCPEDDLVPSGKFCLVLGEGTSSLRNYFLLKSDVADSKGLRAAR